MYSCIVLFFPPGMTVQGRDRKKRVIRKEWHESITTNLQLSLYMGVLSILKEYVMVFQASYLVSNELWMFLSQCILVGAVDQRHTGHQLSLLFFSHRVARCWSTSYMTSNLKCSHTSWHASSKLNIWAICIPKHWQSLTSQTRCCLQEKSMWGEKQMNSEITNHAVSTLQNAISNHFSLFM